MKYRISIFYKIKYNTYCIILPSDLNTLFNFQNLITFSLFNNFFEN